MMEWLRAHWLSLYVTISTACTFCVILWYWWFDSDNEV